MDGGGDGGGGGGDDDGGGLGLMRGCRTRSAENAV